MSKLYVNEMKKIKLKRIFNVFNTGCYRMIYLSLAVTLIHGIVLLTKMEGSLFLWLGVTAFVMLLGYFIDTITSGAPFGIIE